MARENIRLKLTAFDAMRIISLSKGVAETSEKRVATKS